MDYRSYLKTGRKLFHEVALTGVGW